MPLSNLEKAMGTYILGFTPPGRMALKAALAATVTAGRAVAPHLARGAVAAAPSVARGIASPYTQIPIAAGIGVYELQQYLEESGAQEAQNVRVDKVMRFLKEDVPRAGRRRKSIYNKAMAKAMAAVKKSTKGGPKGKLSNAKKTFGQVSKAVSKAKKGGKLGTTGVTGVIKRSISGMFKKAGALHKRAFKKGGGKGFY